MVKGHFRLNEVFFEKNVGRVKLNILGYSRFFNQIFLDYLSCLLLV